MAKYTLGRLGMSLVTLLLIATLTFLLMNSVPGGPWLSEKTPSPETIKALNEKYGLDKPMIVQLGMYFENLIQGDMGVSLKMQKNRPVVDIITEMFPVSAKIGFFAILWAALAGVALGAIAAYQRGAWVDSLLRIVATIGISMPSFVVASLLLTTFAGSNASLRFFPTIFDAALGVKAYILPCFALGVYPMCYIARQTRSAMLDALGQDYIKTAKAKGMKNTPIIFKHALRNALIPVITYLGPQIAFTFCGGFVVETVFSVPGLGRYFIQSISNRDYPIIMGTTIFLAAFIIVMNFLADFLYRVVDPRISIGQGGK
ncbi:MAG: ABC transporter permease [Oscillospiraceae bacterium]|jgi:oligopeptide transport system permease protein|nr:ABC transporter permease [Oscillospiraceae bacterium]